MLTFKVRFPGDSQSLCQILRLGSLLWGLELLQQCKNFFGIIALHFVHCPPGGSVAGLSVTSSTRTHATHHASQACCCQSPCPHGRPLQHASAGDPQTVTGWSASVSCGGNCSFPWVLMCTRFFLCSPSISGGEGAVWGFILNGVALLLLSCFGFLFAVGCGVSFTGGFQHSPVHGCSATSCKFGVFTREDECMSFLGLQNHSRWWLQPSN